MILWAKALYRFAVPLWLLTSALCANADVLVIESSMPELAPGLQIPDNERLSVPRGRSIVIMRPSGETQTISGPYDRLVSEISRGATISEKFRQMKQQLDEDHSGGSIGATRGLRSPSH
jgi:hypothetical protein